MSWKVCFIGDNSLTVKTPIIVDGAVNLLLISLNAFYFSTNRHIIVNSCHYSRLLGSYFHLVHYGDILSSHVNCLSKQMFVFWIISGKCRFWYPSFKANHSATWKVSKTLSFRGLIYRFCLNLIGNRGLVGIVRNLLNFVTKLNC